MSDNSARQYPQHEEDSRGWGDLSWLKLAGML